MPNPVARWRKKPVVIEAWGPLIAGDLIAAAEWCGGQMRLVNQSPGAVVAIETLEGEMVACVGDFIIKGVEGEFYPCKPSIFEASYELDIGGKTP